METFIHALKQQGHRRSGPTRTERAATDGRFASALSGSSPVSDGTRNHGPTAAVTVPLPTPESYCLNPVGWWSCVRHHNRFSSCLVFGCLFQGQIRTIFLRCDFLLPVVKMSMMIRLNIQSLMTRTTPKDPITEGGSDSFPTTSFSKTLRSSLAGAMMFATAMDTNAGYTLTCAMKPSGSRTRRDHPVSES